MLWVSIAVICLAVSICSAQEGKPSPEIAELVNALENEGVTGGNATNRLIAIGKPAIPALLEIIKTKTDKKASLSAIIVGKIGDAETLQQLWELSKSKDSGIRANAVLCISYYSRDAELVVPVLKKGLDDSDAKVRGIASDGILMLAQTTRSNIEALQSAIPGLIENLTNKSGDVRQSAFEALAEMGSLAESATPSLLKLLDSGSVESQLLAIKLLGSIAVNSTEVIAALENVEKNSEKKELIVEAQNAIKSLKNPLTNRKP